MKSLKKYILLWLSQSVSQLGSSMTSFALILWTYSQNGSAMSVSLMTFCNYVPYVAVSLFAGTFVDRHSKKAIMLISDSIAALCTLFVLLLSISGALSVWHIYAVNAVIGFMNAFQQPASAVAIGRIVPKDKLANVSGMNSFSSNLVSVLSPIIAAALFASGGLQIILTIDILSFICAFCVLMFFIRIPETGAGSSHRSVLSETLEGLRFLKGEKGLLYLMLTLSVITFFSMITYENILSPMILSRSGNDSMTLAVVNAVIGISGIVGGIIVSAGVGSKNPVKIIYFSAAISFLFGDLIMAAGRNVIMWSIAGIAANMPIPFVTAGQNMIMYRKIPEKNAGQGVRGKKCRSARLCSSWNTRRRIPCQLCFRAFYEIG